jgi:hypothetical protein
LSSWFLPELLEEKSEKEEELHPGQALSHAHPPTHFVWNVTDVLGVDKLFGIKCCPKRRIGLLSP